MASVMGLRKILLAKLLVEVAVWAVVRIRFVVGLRVEVRNRFVVRLWAVVGLVMEVMEAVEVMEGDAVIIAGGEKDIRTHIGK